jgi:hypothetical protein
MDSYTCLLFLLDDFRMEIHQSTWTKHVLLEYERSDVCGSRTSHNTNHANIPRYTGIAEALLGTVVDGPEVHGMYEVFHDSEDEDRGTLSEEKVEASVADEEEALQMLVDDF